MEAFKNINLKPTDSDILKFRWETARKILLKTIEIDRNSVAFSFKKRAEYAVNMADDLIDVLLNTK